MTKPVQRIGESRYTKPLLVTGQTSSQLIVIQHDMTQENRTVDDSLGRLGPLAVATTSAHRDPVAQRSPIGSASARTNHFWWPIRVCAKLQKTTTILTTGQASVTLRATAPKLSARGERAMRVAVHEHARRTVVAGHSRERRRQVEDAFLADDRHAVIRPGRCWLFLGADAT